MRFDYEHFFRTLFRNLTKSKPASQIFVRPILYFPGVAAVFFGVPLTYSGRGSGLPGRWGEMAGSCRRGSGGGRGLVCFFCVEREDSAGGGIGGRRAGQGGAGQGGWSGGGWSGGLVWGGGRLDPTRSGNRKGLRAFRCPKGARRSRLVSGQGERVRVWS